MHLAMETHLKQLQRVVRCGKSYFNHHTMCNNNAILH